MLPMRLREPRSWFFGGFSSTTRNGESPSTSVISTSSILVRVRIQIRVRVQGTKQTRSQVFFTGGAAGSCFPELMLLLRFTGGRFTVSQTELPPPTGPEYQFYLFIILIIFYYYFIETL